MTDANLGTFLPYKYQKTMTYCITIYLLYHFWNKNMVQ